MKGRQLKQNKNPPPPPGTAQHPYILLWMGKNEVHGAAVLCSTGSRPFEVRRWKGVGNRKNRNGDVCCSHCSGHQIVLFAVLQIQE